MTRSHAFFSSSTTSCPSSSVTMGKLCFLFNVLLMLTCMAPHRMTKAHPLACDCKPGWPLFSLTQPPTSRNDSLGALPPLPPATPAPTSHYDSLGALSPPPPATPASSTPNESL